MLLLLPWDEPTPGVSIEGKATYYVSRLMEEVAANRKMSLDGYAGPVALNRAADLGRAVWIEYNGIIYGGKNGFLSVDCAQEGEHYLAREQKNLVVEVSYEQAQAWHMIKPIPVKVHFQYPWPDPPNSF